MTEILNRIDAALAERCPCGAEPAPGSAWCSEDCRPVPGAGQAWRGWYPLDSAVVSVGEAAAERFYLNNEVSESGPCESHPDRQHRPFRITTLNGETVDPARCACGGRWPIIYERRRGEHVDRVVLTLVTDHLAGDLEEAGFRLVPPDQGQAAERRCLVLPASREVPRAFVQREAEAQGVPVGTQPSVTQQPDLPGLVEYRWDWIEHPDDVVRVRLPRWRTRPIGRMVEASNPEPAAERDAERAAVQRGWNYMLQSLNIDFHVTAWQADVLRTFFGSAVIDPSGMITAVD